MRELAVFVAAVSMVLVLGTSAREEPTDNDRTGLQAGAREEPTEHDGIGVQSAARSSPGVKGSHGRPKRRALLSSDVADLLDDALDAKGSPAERATNVLRQRTSWAEAEFVGSYDTAHVNNGDWSSAATFHKTLPHDSLGRVDASAFVALTECIYEGDFDKCEKVPAGEDGGFLIQPLGGIAIDMAGPASSAVCIPSAPALNSEHLAAHLAEVYWMALTRDVPFSMYGEHETTVAAADNLAAMPGFAKMNGVAVGSDGRADPQSQLFRSSAVGVETGPIISQLLVKSFTLDSIAVTPKQTTFVLGADYMTDYSNWLFIQNGGTPDSMEEEDSAKRYIRCGRDLARLVHSDTIYTEAFRAALILLDEDAISRDGFNGPYADSARQKGFVTFGVSHVMKILGSVEMAQRAAWYQKWNVHLFARPEAVAGTLHNVIYGNLDVEFHASLLENDELLERVASRNAEMNGRGGELGRTYLLSQAVKEGSPAHPSYPAGHAVQNGAFATVLKAHVGLERGVSCFADAVYPDDDGQTLLPYTGDDCLTYEGEINKMAVNIAFGRQMCGVHYRFDSQEGLVLGEIIGVRMLQQEVMAFPENQPYEFRLLAGETIRLEPDGSFYVDGQKCSGDTFLGVSGC